MMLYLMVAILATPPNANAPGHSPRPVPLMDEDFLATTPEQVELGRLLFYDKILSGNRNISCATCHHGHLMGADSLALPLGEGGVGLGMGRHPGGVLRRVPRNSPPYWNLGHRGFTRAFWDGRVEAIDDGFRSPAGDQLPEHLVSVMAVQALFPVTSADEMAGHPGENPQADLVGDLPALWRFVTGKVAGIPEYVDRFVAAYGDDPNIPVATDKDITIVHVANAIAAFESSLRANNTPYDQYLSGRPWAMSTLAKLGKTVFFGSGQCGDCHWSESGLLSDMEFHAIAVPQFGPGKAAGGEDVGRALVTGDPEDAHKFRTPPLRNVALTAPYGHSGAFDTLEAMVQHHLDTINSLCDYDRTQAALPFREDFAATDFAVLDDPGKVESIVNANELEPITLTPNAFEALMAFLTEGLTDTRAFQARQTVPNRVPSGLPIQD